MNYCSNCGSDKITRKTPVDDHQLRLTCSSCESVFYENPKIVVGTIPIFNNKILLAKRGIEPQKGKWNLPAGFLEVNETLEEGATRETVEETNAEISKLKVHSIYQSKSNHLYIFYLAELSSEKYNTTTESTDIRFFNIEDIPWDTLAFSSNTFTLKTFIKERKSSRVHITSE